MKLTDAIRLGSVVVPQEFSGMTEGVEGRCVLNTAMVAIGAEITNSYAPFEVWPWLMTRWQFPCECRKLHWEPEEIGWIAIHLNDTHHWTREQIAAWLSPFEPQDTNQEQACEEAGTSKPHAREIRCRK